MKLANTTPADLVAHAFIDGWVAGRADREYADATALFHDLVESLRSLSFESCSVEIDISDGSCCWLSSYVEYAWGTYTMLRGKQR